MPPLYIWGIVAALAFIVVVLVSSSFLIDIRHGHGFLYRNLIIRLDNLQADAQVSAEEEVVVILGSSLTAMSINHHEYYYQQFQGKNGRPVHVFKIYMYSCSANDLQYMTDYFEMAQKLQPDLLLIEERIFAFNELNDEMIDAPAWLDRFSLGINSVKEQALFAMGKGKFDEPDIFDFFWKYHDETYGEDSTSVQPYRTEVRRWQDNKRVNAWLSQFSKDGTDIVLLNIPRPESVEKGIEEAKSKPVFQALVKRSEAEYGLRQWDYPGYIPYKFFSGDVHLNKEGMLKYSDWLFHKIDAHLYP